MGKPPKWDSWVVLIKASVKDSRCMLLVEMLRIFFFTMQPYPCYSEIIIVTGFDLKIFSDIFYIWNILLKYSLSRPLLLRFAFCISREEGKLPPKELILFLIIPRKDETEAAQH